MKNSLVYMKWKSYELKEHKDLKELEKHDYNNDHELGKMIVGFYNLSAMVLSRVL